MTATKPRVRLCGCSLRKAKAVPVETAVGRHVDAKEPKLSKKITSVLSEHGKRISDEAGKLYEKKIEKVDTSLIDAIIAALLIGKLISDIIDVLTPQMVRSFNEAGKLGIMQVGFETSTVMLQHLDEAALTYAEAHGAELVKGLSTTTEEGLRGTIANAVKGGWSADELAKSIRDSFAFSGARASTIARTELAMAHVQGNVQGWRETGQVEKKEWVLGDLHEVEDECDENATEGAIALDDEFSSGIAFPPAHPNCICDVLPVLSEGGA